MAWHGSAMVGCQTHDQEVVSSIPALALLRNDSGQVIRTQLPLLPCSIIWYRPKLGCSQAHHVMH